MPSKLTRIAIAGVGTVGTGVLNLLIKNKILEKFNLDISHIASRRKFNKKKLNLKNTKIFNDAKELTKIDDYEILIELIGGDEGISKEIVFDALRKGKKVITANKALVSKYWNFKRNFKLYSDKHVY